MAWAIAQGVWEYLWTIGVVPVLAAVVILGVPMLIWGRKPPVR